MRAIVTVPTFDERCRICATDMRSVPRSSASWMRRSATWIEYASVNSVRGVIRCCDSAPAIVTTLNTEPGSKTSVTAWFVCSPVDADAFASRVGASAIARMAPVFGSSTMAVACFALHCTIVWRRTCSAFDWILLSSVRNADLPGRAGTVCVTLIACPNGSCTTVCSPGAPVSGPFSCSSSPESPVLSTPAKPSTGAATDRCGYVRRSSP